MFSAVVRRQVSSYRGSAVPVRHSSNQLALAEHVHGVSHLHLVVRPFLWLLWGLRLLAEVPARPCLFFLYLALTFSACAGASVVLST